MVPRGVLGDVLLQRQKLAAAIEKIDRERRHRERGAATGADEVQIVARRDRLEVGFAPRFSALGSGGGWRSLEVGEEAHAAEHPTFNIQHPTSNAALRRTLAALDVGC